MGKKHKRIQQRVFDERNKRICAACSGQGAIVKHELDAWGDKVTVRTPCKVCKGRKVV